MKRVVVLIGALVVFIVGVTVVFGLMIRARLMPPPVSEIAVPVYPTPEHNGFQLLAEAAARIADRDAGSYSALIEPWDKPDPGTEAVLARNAQALADFRKALQMPLLLPRITSVDDYGEYLRQFRTVSRMLLLEGRAHERAGRYREALDSYATILRLAQTVARNGAIAQALTSVAMTTMAAPDLGRCVGSGELSEQDLRELSALLEKLWRGRIPWHETLAIEWYCSDLQLQDMHDVMTDPERLRKLPGGQSTDAPPPQAVRALRAFGLFRWFLFDRSRVEMKSIYAAAIANAKKPYPQQSYRPGKTSKPLTQLYTLTIYTPMPRVAIRDALLQGLRTQVAIELFRKREGRLPETLADLAPDILPEVPLDPCDGKPMRYVPGGKDYLLYSAGPDAADDGGTTKVSAMYPEPGNHGPTGDVIIWPAGLVYAPHQQ